MDLLDRLLAHDAWTTLHRAQILYLLRLVGAPASIEGDVLSWEQQARRL